MTTDHPIRTAPAVTAAPITGWRRWGLLLGLVWVGLLPLDSCAESVSKEYQLKAAFIYNFTKFVIAWPTNHLVTKAAPITIGVLGKNPFGDELANVVADRKANGHPFLIKLITADGDPKSVDVLFVAQGQEDLLKGDWSALHASGVLTIGESDIFSARGGLINFTTEADRIRFEVNLIEAEKSGFKFSSQMLKVAQIVRRKS